MLPAASLTIFYIYSIIIILLIYDILNFTKNLRREIMQKTKKIIKILLFTTIIFSMSLASVSFANEKQTNNLTNLMNTRYEFNRDVAYEYKISCEEAFIINVFSDNEVIVVPETLGGKKVTYLSARSIENGEYVSPFSNAKNLKTIILPDSIKSIGYRTFYNCKNLEKIVLSKNIRYVGEEAFKNCDKLNCIGINREVKNQNDLRNALLENITDLTKTIYFKNNLM